MASSARVKECPIALHVENDVVVRPRERILFSPSRFTKWMTDSPARKRERILFSPSHRMKCITQAAARKREKMLFSPAHLMKLMTDSPAALRSLQTNVDPLPLRDRSLC